MRRCSSYASLLCHQMQPAVPLTSSRLSVTLCGPLPGAVSIRQPTSTASAVSAPILSGYRYHLLMRQRRLEDFQAMAGAPSSSDRRADRQTSLSSCSYRFFCSVGLFSPTAARLMMRKRTTASRRLSSHRTQKRVKSNRNQRRRLSTSLSSKKRPARPLGVNKKQKGSVQRKRKAVKRSRATASNKQQEQQKRRSSSTLPNEREKSRSGDRRSKVAPGRSSPQQSLLPSAATAIDPFRCPPFGSSAYFLHLYQTASLTPYTHTTVSRRTLWDMYEAAKLREDNMALDKRKDWTHARLKPTNNKGKIRMTKRAAKRLEAARLEAQRKRQAALLEQFPNATITPPPETEELDDAAPTELAASSSSNSKSNDDGTTMAISDEERASMKESDARIAMRSLMGQHFRMTSRPQQEEHSLRRQKLEELRKPLLPRLYVQQVHAEEAMASRWRQPVALSLSPSDTRVLAAEAAEQRDPQYSSTVMRPFSVRSSESVSITSQGKNVSDPSDVEQEERELLYQIDDLEGSRIKDKKRDDAARSQSTDREGDVPSSLTSSVEALALPASGEGDSTRNR